MRLRHPGEHGRREPPAALGDGARGAPALGTLVLAALHELADPRQLLAGVDGADVGVLVEGIAEAQRAEPPLQRCDDLVCYRLLEQQSRSCAAHVSLVEEDAVDDALDGLVDRGVVEDHVRSLAAELEGEALVAAGRRAHDRLAHLRRAGEGDLVDPGMLDEQAPGVARSGEDVDDARGQVGLPADVGEGQRGQRRRLGWLEHDGVAARKGGCDLPGQHEEREVPGNDLRSHTHGSWVASIARMLELVGPARVVEEVRRDQGEVDVA